MRSLFLGRPYHVARGPMKMVSTSEMLQLCRSVRHRESLGSVAGLAQMRLEGRLDVSLSSTDCVLTSPLDDRTNSAKRPCQDAKSVSSICLTHFNKFHHNTIHRINDCQSGRKVQYQLLRWQTISLDYKFGSLSDLGSSACYLLDPQSESTPCI